MVLSALLLDIEGTTTSISFVYDELFPYVSQHLAAYLSSKWDTSDCQTAVKALAEQSVVDQSADVDGAIPIDLNQTTENVRKAVIENVRWQMLHNRKTTALKLLQGFICEDGYNAGDIAGHVYDDVQPNLEKWKSLSKKIYIYSSGSIQAQKLLFGHSTKGDLTKYLDGYFDTTTGQKMNKESYAKISKEIQLVPAEILFLTDIPAEAIAASSAGFQVRLVSRPGNAKLDADITKTYSVINSFNELDIN